MKASELFVRCLENEGVEYVFGIPGEENLDVMDSMIGSDIQFITTRHEQGAAFMADVYGRLTGKAGVCLSTLGPGATNLVTGFADANMDRAPIVGIAGQGATTRMHKESHQILDLVNLFEPISKYSVQIREPEIVAEIVRKAFKAAQAEKPGGSFIDFPENIAEMEVEGKLPLKVQSAKPPVPPADKISQAAELISNARYPLVMAGNGVVRASANDALVSFAEKLNIPVATTFMAKGSMPFSHELSLGTVGLQAHDYVACGFDRADVVICIGYDMIEYHPHLWNKEKTSKIIHIDMSPAEVDEHYILECGVVGDINAALVGIAAVATPQAESHAQNLRDTIVDELNLHADDASFPLLPQRIILDLRKALGLEDIVVCDVGAHKMWMARMYQAERPNTCVISNGFAAMGIGVPGAIAAKLAFPGRTALTVTGDAGFLMNSQEIETALRIGVAIVILVWNDSEYGLIKWHQDRRFGRDTQIEFNNPDFVKYAESFGAKGYRVESADALLPTLQQAIADDTVVVIDCPVDYSENMKLTENSASWCAPSSLSLRLLCSSIMLDLYCERIAPGLWAEPLNAVTNFGFVLVAGLVWRHASRARVEDAGITTLTGLILAIALGSFLFHTLATALARWLDLLPIFGFQLCFIWLYLRRVIVLSTVPCCLLVLLFLLLLVGSMQFPGLFNGSFVYLPTLLVMLLMGSYHYQSKQSGRSLLLIAAALFSLSLWLRTIDADTCVQFQLGTHFLWHLLNALVIYLATWALLVNLPPAAIHRR